MDLQPADIDDATAAADEVITIAPAFQHVAGIAEPIVIRKHYAGAQISVSHAARANAQRAIDNLHLDLAGFFDHIGWKAFAAVIDFKTDSSLGGSVSMADARLRIARSQTVEHRLVCDLARQAHIARRHRLR